MVLGFTGFWSNVGVFLVAAAAIGVVGPRLSRAADRVGRVTGLGQTLAGALLLGASTSLPGLVVTLRTAFGGRANLAVANSLGGIAAQTVFVAIADVALRSDTLEHRDTLAASLLQTAVLVTLLTLLLMALLRPEFLLLGAVHPLSIAVAVGVVLGFRAIEETWKHPSWRARGIDEREDDGDARSEGDSAGEGESTGEGDSAGERGGRSGADGRSGERREDGEGRGGGDEARRDAGDGGGSGEESGSRRRLYARYGLYVAAVGIAGFLISSAAGTVVDRTGFSPVVMGTTFTAMATSLPELVTAVASVRRGAVALAVGDIVGGNAFDTIMAALADGAYLEGSIYGAVTADVTFVAALALLLTGLLAIGLVRRDRPGLGNVGVESYLVLVVYLLGIVPILRGTSLWPW